MDGYESKLIACLELHLLFRYAPHFLSMIFLKRRIPLLFIHNVTAIEEFPNSGLKESADLMAALVGVRIPKISLVIGNRSY